MKPLKALLVEDSETDEKLLLRQLAKAGYDVQSIRVETAADMRKALAELDWDIVLSDYAMPGFSGLGALRVLKESGRDIPLIIISGTIGEDVAVEAMRVGVDDYLMKGNLTRLAPAIERELENAASRHAQKRAEESLRRSEKNLADAQRITHIGSWETDLVNNHLFWSDEVYRIFGVSKDDFGATLESFISFIHPEDRQSVQDAADAALWQNAPYNIEHRIITRAGVERIVCEIGEVSFDEAGKPVRMTGTVQDITERKRNEEALKNAAKRERAMIENALDVICTIDAEGKFVSVSPASLKVWGYQPEELVGHSYEEFVVPEDVAQSNEEVLKVMSGIETTNFDNRYLHKNGSMIHIRWTAFWSVTEQLMFCVAHDITERRRIEKALRASEAELRALFAAITDAIIVLDAEGRYQKIAPTDPAYLYKPSAELLGKRLDEVFPEEVVTFFLVHIRRALDEGQMHRVEYSLQISGTEVWFDGSVSPISEDSVIWIARDITERRRAEEEKMMLTAQIEQQHERLDNILANVPGVVWEAWGKPDAATQRIDFVSEYVETMLGYTVEEWLTTPSFWLSIVHPEDKEWIGREAVENFLAGQAYTRQFRWIAKDGRTVWVESQATVICDETGQPIGMRGINIDITERKQLEEERTQLTSELASEKARLQHIFDNSPSFIVSLRGPDFVFEMANPAYYQLVGQRDLIGIPALEALPEIMTQGLPDIIRRVYNTGEPFIGNEVPVKLQPPNAAELEQHYINFVYMPLREADTSISGIASYGIDVTEQVLSRMKVQESVREQMELTAQLETERMRLVTAQSVAKVGSWETDLVTQKVNWSAETFRIFELDPNKFQPDHRGFLQFVHPDDRAAVEDAFTKSFDLHSVSSFEHRVLLADGKIKFIEERWEILRDEQGKPLQLLGTSQDITERKRAEKLIIESEEKYRIIVETANEGIWQADVESVTTYVNAQMAEMLGYTVDEMVGRPIFDFIFEDDFSDAKHKVTQRFDGVSETNEFRLRKKDGSEIITQYNASPIRNQGGEIVGFLSMNTDITERKKTEESIRFQAHLLNTVEQAVVATDLNGIVTYWNQYAEKLYGWTPAEAIGRTVFELTTPELINLKQAKQIMSRLSSGTSWAGEFVTRNKAGVHFPAYVSNSPVYDDTGKLVGIVGVSVDITERKNAETALRLAEDKYRSLVESSPAIVYLKEPHPPYSTIYVSPNVEIFGYSPEEWYAEPGMWSSMLYKEDRERVLHEFESAARHDLETELEYRIVARDGNIHWWQDKGRFIADEEGNGIGWQGVILDVTKSKALEEQLYQSQKLESVGRLAGGIAHDFNNMLTAINGYSELTLRKLDADNPLRRNIEEIKKAGERSAQLTHQLLAFSRQQVLQPVVLDINEAITDTIKLLERLIGEDVKLVIALNSRTGRVNVDPGQLSQIIMNLAVNARDAMPNGGELTIETANVFFEPENTEQKVGVLPGAYVMLAVCDTGEGMDDTTQQRIFEPFFTTKELGKGTGLGLATVYGIVKQSGGNIEVDSQIGAGTTFRVYLPRVAEQSEAVEITDSPAEFLTGTETILLVEDEELVRKLSREMLETCGYTVIEAREGLEALKIWEAGDCKPDLLITDVVMPQMGGRELAEKLKERLPDIKILFTSGYTDDAVIRYGVIEPNTNFIQKPFTFDALNRKVRELLGADDLKINT